MVQYCQRSKFQLQPVPSLASPRQTPPQTSCSRRPAACHSPWDAHRSVLLHQPSGLSSSSSRKLQCIQHPTACQNIIKTLNWYKSIYSPDFVVGSDAAVFAAASHDTFVLTSASSLLFPSSFVRSLVWVHSLHSHSLGMEWRQVF